MSKLKVLLLAGVAAASLSNLALAETTPASPFSALAWRSIGPFRGGRVLAVSGASDNPQHFFFGSVNGGVWETKDAGRTWDPIFDNEPVASIGALAVGQVDPKLLWVGTGESDMRSDIAQGQGLFKSTDGGKTWAFKGLADTQQIAKILIDPRDANTVLVAALGHPYGPNAERGVFRTTDGGTHWTKVLFKDADTGAIDLVFKPGDPKTVYAGLWQTRRPPWNVYPPSSGPGGGLYKSTDGGATWTQLKAGLPSFTGRIGLAVSDAAPNRVYALIDGKPGGLWRSDDDGATWTKVTSDARIWNRGWYFGQITANPKNPDQVWVCDTIVLRSDDGGRSFIPLKGDPTGDDFHALWVDPTDPARRILGVDQGTLVTLNGGATWSSWFNQPTGQFYHVATDNRFPYRVYGAQQDSGAADVPSRTGSWDGVNMTHFHESAAGGESDSIAPDPEDPDTIFGGRVDKLDRRTGQLRDVDPTLAYPGAYNRTWTLPLIFGPDGKTLYFSNQKVFATNDGGDHWRPISPDLERIDTGVPANLDAPTLADTDTPGPRRGVVYSIGPSPLDVKDIWVGTDDGLVWRTRDGGDHWRDITPPKVGPWAKVGGVEPSHFAPDTAFLAVDKHRLDDPTPYVWRTRDGGKTWSLITTGLPASGSVNVVREDPVQRGLLFAGTEHGAFISLDDGDHWAPLQSGLPTTSVRDMTIHDMDLVIATHGRAFWILDDIEPLREMAAKGVSQSGEARLFTPATAVRMRPEGFTGTPMPKDEPMAADPPFGAYLDYALKSDAKGPLTVTIKDAKGDVVRSYASTDPDPAPDLAKLDIAPEWAPRTPPPSASAGAHRLVWDLHYAVPADLGANRFVGGVWAPPGDYTVTLSVDGESLEAPLKLVPDPRIKASPASYQAEFDLARRIEADRARVADALTSISKTNLPPTAAPALRDIAQRLVKLQGAVDGADGGPTPDAKAGYAAASSALAAILGNASPQSPASPP